MIKEYDPDEFEIEGSLLKKYKGGQAHVAIPDGVTVIGREAFHHCKCLSSVLIPAGVVKIEPYAFSLCSELKAVSIPEGLTEIGEGAFFACRKLFSLTLPGSLRNMEKNAFYECTSLASITIPDGLTEIGESVFEGCERLSSVILSDQVKKIGSEAFRRCTKLSSIHLPDGLSEIGSWAFEDCRNLSSIQLPGSLSKIDSWAFQNCSDLTSIAIPDSLTEIGWGVFEGCRQLTSVTIPDSVEEIDSGAFNGCPSVTVICREGSCAHDFCQENNITYLFDYQFEAFGGLLPPGIEKLSSPFLADEEKPYVFISYSHKDREPVLAIIKSLYEAGWKIWYDEGLTIGDRYDQTLENHVKNCSAFLLFVTRNSAGSFYIKDNEIPWAVLYGRPVIKCMLHEGSDLEIPRDLLAASVSPSEIGHALEQIDGLTKGERRTAKGISVVVNPADRDEADGDGYAYCLYSDENAPSAQSVMLEARNNGCSLYDAVEQGERVEKLEGCACLIVFLDHSFLSDPHLADLLIREYRAGRDIAVCQLEEMDDDDLPDALLDLRKMQWLYFVDGITADMNTKLARHLQKRGCRKTSVLPGFEYEIEDGRISINRYTGMDQNPVIESEYGGAPVIEIGENAFKNCFRIKTVTLPGGIREIRYGAFEGCSSLVSVELPEGLLEIGPVSFKNCTSLTSVCIPESLLRIGRGAFENCSGLTSVILPDQVWYIDSSTFEGCTSLRSVRIPAGVRGIGEYAFLNCVWLSSLLIPEQVAQIGHSAFNNCKSLKSITIPGSVTEIGETAFIRCESLKTLYLSEGVAKIGAYAFEQCISLTSAVIPDSVAEIGENAFVSCPGLTVSCPRHSYAWKYCRQNNIPVKAAGGGFLSRLFGI